MGNWDTVYLLIRALGMGDWDTVYFLIRALSMGNWCNVAKLVQCFLFSNTRCVFSTLLSKSQFRILNKFNK